MRSLITRYCLALVALVAFTTSANAVVRNDGTVGTPSSFGGTVAFGTSSFFNASATVIGGGNYVITAAHAIGAGTSGSSYRIQLQNGSIISGTGTVVTDPNPNADIAIVQLSSPVSTFYDLYNGGGAELGRTVVFTGWGLSSTNTGDGSANIGYGTPRQGSNVISGITGPNNNELNFDFDKAGTALDANNDSLGNPEATTFGGDSGMGWLTLVNGSYQLIGVHDGIYSQPGLNRDQTISYATRVSVEMPWILANIPEPGAAAIFCITLLLSLSRRRAS